MESLVNSDLLLGRGFKEFNSQGVCVTLAFLEGNLSAFGEIALISNQNFSDIGGRVLLDFAEPVLNLLETLFVSDVVN